MSVPLLKIVQLTLTNRCQCNCEHCGVFNLRDSVKGELSLEQLDHIFRDLKQAGCQVIDLFGGEPTLRRDLFEIIAHAKALGFLMSLETNGFVLDQEFVNRLHAAKLDQIYLSLDDYRAEFHDRRRRTPGSFDRAVRALELAAKTSILVHVSIVPQTKEFFTEGHMNRFMEFVLARGAKQVRLLLPRYVGKSIHGEDGPFGAGQEADLFRYVSAEYREMIYVHTPGTHLGEDNLCTAKNVFCHIMSNGWVAPCPYFPLVFGDATREPILNIFERIQSHPLVRLGGVHCPMRNAEYIEHNIAKLGLDRPFFPMEVRNHILLGASCTAGCTDCKTAQATPRPAEDVIRDLRDLDPNYSSVEFFGGDALLREDLFDILDHVPSSMDVSLWTACSHWPADPHFVTRLLSHRVEAIKVLLPLWLGGKRELSPDELRLLVETLTRVRAVASWSIPVQLYVPADASPVVHDLVSKNIPRLGLERVYLFKRDVQEPLKNAVACFGRELGSVKLVWKQSDAPVRLPKPLCAATN